MQTDYVRKLEEENINLTRELFEIEQLIENKKPTVMFRVFERTNSFTLNTNGFKRNENYQRIVSKYSDIVNFEFAFGNNLTVKELFEEIERLCEFISSLNVRLYTQEESKDPNFINQENLFLSYSSCFFKDLVARIAGVYDSEMQKYVNELLLSFKEVKAEEENEKFLAELDKLEKSAGEKKNQILAMFADKFSNEEKKAKSYKKYLA